MKVGKVYMIGAGCGRYDLITIRGMEALKKCDVVLYDSLIDPQLLAFLPECCEKIYVGKRAGKHSMPQEKINALLVQKAEQGYTVARLKGGDPFVFGRGSEELLVLIENAIPFEVIPGISSAVAVPEMAGIPVTHRGISRSFHVITGHTKDDLLPEQFSLNAKLSGTLVFLMGLHALEQIAHDLLQYGRSPDTPAAVISHGGTAMQQVIHGKLQDISEIAKANKISSPAVIVVGDTAALALHSPEKKRLGGISVTTVGTKKFTQKLAQKLTEQGASVDCENTFSVVSYENDPHIAEIFADMASYTMIVLTSQNGAELFFRVLQNLHIDLRKLSGIRFAVIGSATANVLQEHGIYADLIPETFSSECLAEMIIRHKTEKENLLLLRAERASSELPELLSQQGIPFRDVKLYDVKYGRTAQPREIHTDYVVFGSSSEAADLYHQGYTLSADTTAICLGVSTASAIKKLYGIDAAIPKMQTADGIVQLIQHRKGRSE